MTFLAAQSLPEQIADHIREKIIRFELKPGQSIREAQLAAGSRITGLRPDRDHCRERDARAPRAAVVGQPRVYGLACGQDHAADQRRK